MAFKTKITINPDFESLRQFVDEVPFRNQILGTVIYSGRNVVFKNTETGTPLCVKSFKVPPIYNRIAYTFLRKSKARRSYENALKLLEMGIPTPTPVAYAEVYASHLLQHSYYICLMLDAQDVRSWQDRPDGEDIAGNIAKLLYNMHCARIWHRDFSAGNVIYDNARHFYVIDINRMQFGVSSKKKFLQNFLRINESAEATAHLVELYAKIAGISDVKPLTEKVLKAHHKFWEKLHARNRRRAMRQQKRNNK